MVGWWDGCGGMYVHTYVLRTISYAWRIWLLNSHMHHCTVICIGGMVIPWTMEGRMKGWWDVRMMMRWRYDIDDVAER